MSPLFSLLFHNAYLFRFKVRLALQELGCSKLQAECAVRLCDFGIKYRFTYDAYWLAAQTALYWIRHDLPPNHIPANFIPQSLHLDAFMKNDASVISMRSLLRSPFSTWLPNPGPVDVWQLEATLVGYCSWHGIPLTFDVANPSQYPAPSLQLSLRAVLKNTGTVKAFLESGRDFEIAMRRAQLRGGCKTLKGMLYTALHRMLTIAKIDHVFPIKRVVLPVVYAMLSVILDSPDFTRRADDAYNYQDILPDLCLYRDEINETRDDPSRRRASISRLVESYQRIMGHASVDGRDITDLLRRGTDMTRQTALIAQEADSFDNDAALDLCGILRSHMTIERLFTSLAFVNWDLCSFCLQTTNPMIETELVISTFHQEEDSEWGLALKNALDNRTTLSVVECTDCSRPRALGLSTSKDIIAMSPFCILRMGRRALRDILFDVTDIADIDTTSTTWKPESALVYDERGLLWVSLREVPTFLHFHQPMRILFLTGIPRLVLLQVDNGENRYPQFNRALVAIVFRNHTSASRRDIPPEFTGNFPLCDLCEE